MGTHTTTKLIALFPRLVVFASVRDASRKPRQWLALGIVTVPNGLQVEVDVRS